MLHKSAYITNEDVLENGPLDIYLRTSVCWLKQVMTPGRWKMNRNLFHLLIRKDKAISPMGVVRGNVVAVAVLFCFLIAKHYT